MICTIVLLIILCALNLVDYVQTMYAVQNLGINVEVNPIGRFLIESGYGWIPKLIIVPLALLVVGYIIYIDRRFKFVVYFLLLLYGFVITSNFAVLNRVGLI